MVKTLKNGKSYQLKYPASDKYGDIGEYIKWKGKHHVFKHGRTTALLTDEALEYVREKPRKSRKRKRKNKPF